LDVQVIVILKIFSLMLRLVPTPLRRKLGDWAGDFAFFVVRFRRDVVEENFRLAGLPLSLVRENYRHYGRLLMEVGESITWSKSRYRKIPIQGEEHIRPLIEKKQGFFLLTLHLANWEFLGAVSTQGVPLTVVVKKAKVARAEKLQQWYRARTGTKLLHEEGTARDILRGLGEGRVVAFFQDQFMGPPIGLPVKFFNRLAGTAVALALLTERRNVPIVPAYVVRDEKGDTKIVFEAPLQFPIFSEEKNDRLHQKTQFLNDVLERIVRAHPEQWLWLHRRWKPFRGEARWQPSTAMVATLTGFMLALLVGCSSTPGTTPTGIAIPPDPKVEMPTYVPNAAAFEAKPVPPPPPTGLKKKKKKGKKVEEKVVTAPTPTPVFDAIAPENLPFEVGEQMEIDLNWMALPAGRALLEVRKGEPFNGRPTFHLWGNILSSKLVDAIYHVDNTIESIIDASGLLPYKFLLHMVESVQLKETRVAFDHLNNKAFYWSKRISQRWGNEDQDRVEAIAPKSRDMFSGLYFIRTLNYELNKPQTVRVYENKQNLEIELLPVANEFVNTRVGAFQCWKIKLAVKIDNVLKPSGDVFLWVSDDTKKYFVKFDAKLKIGSLYGNLVGLRERQ